MIAYETHGNVVNNFNIRVNKAHIVSLLAFSLISTACILLSLLKYSHYGFDFTDESFYLVWMSNPFLYDWSFTQFGFIYHPLYQWFKGNIAALRQANVFITFSLAFFLVNTLLKYSLSVNWNKIYRLVVAAGLASVSLMYFDTWLATPSYNSLALQALFIVVSGLILIDAKTSKLRSLAGIIIGVGGWLAFMGKPTTAGILAFFVASYLVITKKLTYRLLLLALITPIILLALSAFIIDGSVGAFISRLQRGLQFSGYLEGGYSLTHIFRLDIFLLPRAEILVLISCAFVSFIAGYAFGSEKKFIRWAGFLLSLLFFIVICLFTIGDIHRNFHLSRFQNILIGATPLAAGLLSLAKYKANIFKLLPLSHWVLFFLLLAMPHIYAFGSNINYWEAGSAAGIFWLLAGLILIGPVVQENDKGNVMLPLVLCSQMIVVLLLQTAVTAPRRQTPLLLQNDYLLEVGKPGSSLLLSKEFGNYLKEAIDQSQRVGMEKGTPLIDLTGQSPGLLYALQAESIGQAWMIGDYPGSLKLASESLKRVPCNKLASAWLLIEPTGPRKISPELLATFGANLQDHYSVAATWITAPETGGYAEPRQQMLLKPTRQIDMATQTCNAVLIDQEKV